MSHTYDLSNLGAIKSAIELALKADDDQASERIAWLLSSMHAFSRQFMASYQVQHRPAKRIVRDERGNATKSVDETDTLVRLVWEVPALGGSPGRTIVATLEPSTLPPRS